MCCEQETCALAVHNEVEGICFLKNSEAVLSAYDVDAVGLSSYTIETREGKFLRVRHL